MLLGGLVLEARQVVLVHGEDVVEALEVVAADASGTDSLERHSTPFRGRARPVIRRLADVVGMCPRRVDLDVLRESGDLDVITKYAFRRRRTADIAHADKQDRGFLFEFSH